MKDDILEKILKLLFDEKYPGREVLIINLEPHVKDAINESLLKANPETPALIVGLDDELGMQRRDHRFRLIVMRPRTAYVQLPCDLDPLMAAVERIMTTEPVPANPVAEMALQFEERKSTVGSIKHQLDYPTPDRIRSGTDQARKELGLRGTDEEVMAAIMEMSKKESLQSECAGQVLPGVFCDVQGTLMDYDAKVIQPEILEMLQKYASEGKGIFLWTGGDLDKIRKTLLHQKITWPVLSKYNFKNCTVEIAIDDKPEKELEKDYGFRAQTFVLWDPDEIWS